MNDDTIYRQAAIDCVNHMRFGMDKMAFDIVTTALLELPSAQSTLYGYKIEHLAYIARVMEKEGVTAEYAVKTFDDMKRVVKMILDETQQEAEEILNGCRH